MNKKTWELLPFWFPVSKVNQKWAIVFITLTIVSIDWWSWESSTRFADWIPIWIIYSIMIQFALAYSTWKFAKVFNPFIIERKFESREKEPELKEEETEENVKEPETEITDIAISTEEELVENDSKNTNITNIYISDSVINRSNIGEKNNKDE
ncbi:hypothetical protein OAI71_00255 [Marine Group III euryarchaeote]|nr:hypothetical protein [Marine Group III euryarchaeote]